MKKLCISIIILILYISSLHIYTPKEKTIVTSTQQNIEYSIFVDVEESKLYLLENGEITKTYKCSGGK